MGRDKRMTRPNITLREHELREKLHLLQFYNNECNGFDCLAEILQGDQSVLPQFEKLIGEFELLAEEVERVSGDRATTRYVFRIGEGIYALDTVYDSWDGSEFDTTALMEVKAIQVLVTEYVPL